jgi:hypothetical protein
MNAGLTTHDLPDEYFVRRASTIRTSTLCGCAESSVTTERSVSAARRQSAGDAANAQLERRTLGTSAARQSCRGLRRHRSLARLLLRDFTYCTKLTCRDVGCWPVLEVWAKHSSPTTNSERGSARAAIGVHKPCSVVPIAILFMIIETGSGKHASTRPQCEY